MYPRQNAATIAPPAAALSKIAILSTWGSAILRICAYGGTDQVGFDCLIQRSPLPECWMTNDGLASLDYVTDPTHGATRLSVGFLRSLGMKVGWDPDNGHQHHGAVWDITTSFRKRMQKSAVTVRKAAGEL
jgi:hypothetical protein